MAEELGTALVEIQAPLKQIQADLAKIDGLVRKTVGKGAELKVDADTRAALAKIEGVGTEVKGIPDGDVMIDADAAAALGAVQSIETGLAGLQDESIGITADPSDALRDVGSVGTAIAGLQDESIGITVEGAAARAEVQTVEAALAGLEDQTVRVNVEAEELSATLAGLGTGMGGVAGQAQGMRSSVGGSVAEMLGFGAAVDAADGSLDMLGGRLGGAVRGFGMLKAGAAGLTGAGATAAFYDMGTGALELKDAVNATNNVFGDSRRIIDDWASNSVDRVGLSERAFRDLAGPIGAISIGLGASREEAVALTTEMISFGADMSSVLGGATADAVGALTAALAGEMEGLKRYGVIIDQTAVQQRALEMGLLDTSGAVTNQAAVIRSLVAEQLAASGIAGDFARTQGEGVNAVREAGAAVEDAKVTWGEVFAPAVEEGARRVKEFAEASDAALPAVEFLADAVGTGLGMAMGPIKLVGEGASWAMGLFGDKAEKAAHQARMASEAQRDLAASTRQGLGGHHEAARAATIASEAQRDLANANRGGLGAAQESENAARNLANGVNTTGDAARRAAETVGLLTDSLNLLIGVNLSAEQADIRFRDALAGLTEAMRTNGATLDINTEKGRLNRTEIVGAAQDALSHVEAVYRQTDSLSTANEMLGAYREQLIAAAVAGGLTRAEAERYIGTLGLNEQALGQVAGATDQARGSTDQLGGSVRNIPQSWHTRVTADTSDAEAKLQAIIRRYDGLNLRISAQVWETEVRREAAWAGRAPTAHAGGHITPFGLMPLKHDEMLIKAQHGETILPRMAGGYDDPMLASAARVERDARKAEAGGQVHNHFYGSVMAERDLSRSMAQSQGKRNYVAGRR